ncbi:hypothetical protein SeMB42_g04759 [Synchytrium endobioticum]|uniref:Prokaryotic-type class I peptide chain release factors domain-containing protein n=1 Tax=Synchytrium endobioticum TaxID=286115 RepID=A0A507CW27_9FUNG|nr:hypothetical protein SeMB42_g04759 [Synchytrium endobioticum]TPX49875.1 hypothetical protein SeLEV6574_g01228 [Synchytrium endobioticum]
MLSIAKRLFATSSSSLDTSTRKALRQFAASFQKSSIPRDQLDFSFSRSSGPGGQNVNKVNTKVDIRFNISNASWLPDIVKAKISEQLGSKTNRQGDLIITSNRYRTQNQNLEDCIDKLHGSIVDGLNADLPGETSEATKTRVKKLQAMEKERIRKLKDARKSTKQARSRRLDD